MDIKPLGLTGNCHASRKAFCYELGKRDCCVIQVGFYVYIILAVVVSLYSSVGHGGASGYLAFMALVGVEIYFMHSTTLTLNLFVSAIVFINFYRSGFFRLNLIWPFLITSIPFALGCRIRCRSAGL